MLETVDHIICDTKINLREREREILYVLQAYSNKNEQHVYILLTEVNRNRELEGRRLWKVVVAREWKRNDLFKKTQEQC